MQIYGAEEQDEAVAVADDPNSAALNQRFITQLAAKWPTLSVHIGARPIGDESVGPLREFRELHGYPDLLIKKSTPFL